MARSVVQLSYLGNSPRREFSRVGVLAPFTWVRQGLDDFGRAPAVSLIYGAVFSALSFCAVLQFEVLSEAILGYLTVLVIAGPFLAAGIYATSRDLEQGSLPKIRSSVHQLWGRWSYLGLYSLALAALVLCWARLCSFLFSAYFYTLPIPPSSLPSLLSSNASWLVLGAILGLAIVMAWLVFALSAIATPLVFDGDVDLVTSMISSYQAVSLNPGPMLLWLGIVVLVTLIGVATWCVGFVLLFPVLAYGTWHSYRDLVKSPLSTS